MESANLLILPIIGFTALERAMAINAELYAIERPKQLRDEKDVTNYLFNVIKHPEKDECVLVADKKYVVKVDPNADIRQLVLLFPSMSDTEKQVLYDYIKSNNEFLFENIIPSDAVILTDDEMNFQGWFPPITNQ